MKKFFRFCVFIVLFLVLAGTAISVFQPRIPLGSLFSAAAPILSSISGKQFEIHGNFYLTPGEWVRLEVENGVFSVSDGGGQLKVDVSSAAAAIHLVALLQKKIVLGGIYAHDFSIRITGEKDMQTGEVKPANQTGGGGGSQWMIEQTGKIDLSDFSLSMITNGIGHATTLELHRVSGGFYGGNPGSLTVSGSVNRIPFQGRIDAEPLNSLTKKIPLAFSAQLKHRSMEARAEGKISHTGTGHTLVSTVSLSGQNFNDLSALIGRRGSDDVPFSLSGKLTIGSELLQIAVTEMQPFGENTEIRILRKRGGGGSEYTTEVTGDRIDLDSLKTLITASANGDKVSNAGNGGRKKNQPKKISIDDVLLPSKSLFPSAAVFINLQELILADKTISDLHFQGASQNGVISRAPFSANFRHQNLQGTLSLNLMAETPRISLQLTSRSWDIGGSLEECQLAEGVDLNFDKISSVFATSGRTLRELFSNLAIDIDVEEGKWLIRDANTEGVIDVAIKQAKLSAEPGNEVRFEVDGFVRDQPVSIVTAIADRRGESVSQITELPFSQQWNVAGVTWRLDGKIPFPVKFDGVSLNSSFSGEKLSDLSTLIHLELPQTGPYRFDGTLTATADGYSVSNLLVAVGASTLKGDLLLNTRKKPPKLSLQLAAESIQLTDFKVAKSPADSPEEKTEKEKNKAAKRGQKKITDQAHLKKYDADVRIEVGEVYSGQDYLGKGLLHVKQEKGALSVSPLQIYFPQGEAVLEYHLQPRGEGQAATVSVIIQDLDYGIIGRWFKPETKAGGVINIQAYLQGVSSEDSSFMSSASGYFDLSLQPEKIQAGVVDYWAINLFSFLVPFLAPNNESKVNCAAGRFNLENGVLTEEQLLFDTTRIQVRGTATVDFKNRTIDARLRPVPKRPQFYSLATPIDINGTFDDIDAGVSASGIISTIIRLATSYIIVPIQWIILDRLPADGTEQCLQLVKER